MVSVTVVRTLSFSMYQKSKSLQRRTILSVSGKSPLAVSTEQDLSCSDDSQHHPGGMPIDHAKPQAGVSSQPYVTDLVERLSPSPRRSTTRTSPCSSCTSIRSHIQSLSISSSSAGRLRPHRAADSRMLFTSNTIGLTGHLVSFTRRPHEFVVQKAEARAPMRSSLEMMSTLP